jgi:hypothetical protein
MHLRLALHIVPNSGRDDGVKTFIVKRKSSDVEERFLGTNKSSGEGMNTIYDDDAVVVQIPDKDLEYWEEREEDPLE